MSIENASIWEHGDRVMTTHITNMFTTSDQTAAILSE